MPSVMIRRNESGGLLFYVAKKDLEETVTSVELDSEQSWGGEVELADGPISPRPRLPVTVRAKRL